MSFGDEAKLEGDGVTDRKARNDWLRAAATSGRAKHELSEVH